jgi:hypothetical protein
MTKRQVRDLRAERFALLARYDGGAMAPAVFERLKEIEIALSWAQHYDAKVPNGCS